MSVLGSTVSEYGSSGKIVEVATPDYLERLGIDEYFKRCLELGIPNFNKGSREFIFTMKQLSDEGEDYDLDEMEKCMAKTFSLRFKDITEHGLSVRNAVAIYPGLLNFQELRREFERIAGVSVQAFETHLGCVLTRYAENQLAMEYYTCTNRFCRDSLEILREGRNHTASLTAARIMIFCCAQSDQTWWDVVFKVAGESEEKGISRPHPTVIVNGSPFQENCADVYCEQIKIVGGVNFYEAILTCYYLYYVFNLTFPPVDEETFQQLENLVNLMKEGKAGAAE